MAGTTQVPRIVQSVLKKGTAAGAHMQHGSMASMKSPKSSGGGSGGGGGGGKGSSSPLAGGFDSEGGTYDSANATTASGHIGPFAWGGDLTEGAKRVRQKMMDTDTAAGKALDQLGEKLSGGQNIGEALRDVWKSNPSALHDMVAGGLFKNGLESIAKTLNQAGQQKGANFQVVGNQVVDKSNATSRTIQGEDGPMAPTTQGGFGMIPDPNNPGQMLITSLPGSAPGKAGGRPTVVQPNAQTAQAGVANRDAKTGATVAKDQSQTDLNQARTVGQDQKNADPYAGKPYKIPKADGDYLDAAPAVLGSMEIMRRWAPDANGLLTGPAGDLASKLFGTNDANVVWGAAKNTLQQSLSIGGIPSKYAGSMNKFLGTLPQSWENARFNTTELSSSAAAFRQIGNAKIANVEQENGGRPYTQANQNELREVGIIPPSAGWDNPLAIAKSGPEALKNATYDQLNFLADHQHMLSPSEKAAVKAEAMRKAAEGANPPMQPQDQNNLKMQATPGEPNSAGVSDNTPPVQDPQMQGQLPGPAGTNDDNPPTPGQLNPQPPQPQDTSPLAPNPRLGQATQTAGEETD